MPTISFAQAAVNALADWLQTSLTADVQVLKRWPSNATPLAVNSLGRIKTVSITKVGKFRRIDGNWPLNPLGMQFTTPTSANATFPVGGGLQPLQIDIWCAYDADRDDVLEQLQTALTAGVDLTIGGGRTADPVSDGITLALKPDDTGYVGFVDYMFDEPDIDDLPDSIQKAEYRATYLGEARGTFARTRPTPILKAATLNLTASEQSPAPTGFPVDQTVVTSR